MNKTVRELLHQLIRRADRSVVSTTDPGAHGHINNITSLLKERGKICEKDLSIQQTGPDLSAVAKALIISMSVKAVDIAPVCVRLTVHGILTGQKRNSLQHIFGQIRASVCKNFK